MTAQASVQLPDKAGLYDTDIIAWARQQASLLRAGRLAELDIDHITEEIEDVGKSEQRELASRMAVLITHLIKWRYTRRTWVLRKVRGVYRARKQGATRSNSGLYCDESQHRYRVREACITAENPCVAGIPQPQRRGHSWQYTIRAQRRAVALRIERTPSLKAMLRNADWREEIWSDAVAAASAEADLEDLPLSCPWSLAQVLDSDWLLPATP